MGTALRQITGDLGKSQKIALGILQGRDDDVGPEQGPVFPDAPTLILKDTYLAGDPQLVLRPLLVSGVIGIEDREMLSDDFLCTIALEALGAGVPGEHVACRVEHEDRIIAHALDQQPEALLAVAHGLFIAGLWFFHPFLARWIRTIIRVIDRPCVIRYDLRRCWCPPLWRE